ncbi:MAG TPA: VCBS repeat-containing protein, partial [Blastocatellia bacterium]
MGFWEGDQSGVEPANVPHQPYPGGRPFITTGFYSTLQNVSVDGATPTTATQTPTLSTSQVEIGHAKTYQFTGDYAEVVLYNEDVGAAARNRIESYLALKYGITLNNGNSNYVASDGTTVAWTSDPTYKNDIAGIGRDDNSAFNQKQSASVNVGNILTIGHGAIAATNQANANNFSADRNFMVWAHDGGSVAQSVTVAGTSPLLTRLGRVWKVQESLLGAVGNVVVRIPAVNLAGISPTLIRSTDATFTGSDTLVPLALNGANYEATINFANGDFFTFGAFLTAPGGVTTNLSLWYRADAGTSSMTDGGAINQWNDQSGKNNNAVQATAINQPTFRNNSSDNINFNPVVKFDGGDDRMTLNGTLLPLGTSGRSIVGVARMTGTSSSYLQWGVNGTGTAYSLEMPATRYSIDSGNSVWGAPPGLGSSMPRLFTNTMATGVTMSALKFFLEGRLLTSSASFGGNVALNTSSGAVANLGTPGIVSAGSTYNGRQAETVVYGEELTGTNLAKVQSYFAIKYGITLDQTTPASYLASDGAVIWDAATNAGYKNNIAGIGRDDLSNLSQKQSASVNAGNIVTIGNVAIAASNPANPNNFSADKNFLVWGDNGFTTAWGTAVGGTSLFRMTRIWKAQETGTVGNVVVRIPKAILGGIAPTLLRSTDATFDSSDTQIAMTVNGSNLEATIDFANGDFFSFASQNAPILINGGTGYETDGVVAGANPPANTPTCNPKQFWEHNPLVENGQFSGATPANVIQAGQTANESSHLVDVNGDGKLDFIWVHDAGGPSVNNGTFTWLGNGDGTFQKVAIRDTGGFDGGPLYVGWMPAGGHSGNETTFLADANNDGKVDIVWVYDAGGTANAGTWVWLGNGDGTFQHNVIVDNGHLSGGVPGYTYSIFGGYTANESTHLADTNGDGKLDIVLLYDALVGPTSGSRVYLGNGNGTWAKTPIVDTGWAGGVGFAFSAAGGETANESTFIVDLDKDGIVDVVWVYDFGRGPNSGTYMWKGIGDGTFQNTPIEDHGLTDPFNTWGAAGGQNVNESTRIVDVNRDGNLDLLWLWDAGGNTSQSGSYVWLGNGNGTFNHTPIVDAGGFKGNSGVSYLDAAGVTGVESTLVGDLNGDTMPDLVWMYEGGGSAVSGAYVYLGKDSEGDGLADIVDPDDDNDSVPDTSDACDAPGLVASGLQLWLKADKGVQVNGSNNFTFWADQSPFGRDTNIIFSDPQRIDAALNFNPTVRLDGDDYFRFGSSPFSNTFTAGEVFAVLRNNAYTTANSGHAFDFGSGNRNSHYVHSNANIYDGFGTNNNLAWNPITKTIIDAKPGVSSITGPAVDPRLFNIYGVHSAA